MPYASPFPPVDIPDIDLWTLLFERKDRPFGNDKEIFTDGETGRSYTLEEIRHTAIEFGKGLKAQWNWKKGDVLAFYTPNSSDTGPVTLGLLWAGGIASPANPLYTVDELTSQLKTAKAKAVVTMEPFLKTTCEAAKRAGIPESRIILLGDRRDESGKFRHFCSVRSTSYTGRYARTKINPKKDLAFLVFSSGTTGLPKGVCLSHYNMVANLLQFAQMDGMTFLPLGGVDGKGDKQLGTLPFFHIYVVIMQRFDLERACQLIQDYKITWTYIPPPIVLGFGKHPVVEKYDLSSLKLLHSAAAPLTRELTEAVWNRLKIPVKQGFGLSETSPVCHCQNWDEWAKFMGSVGKLAPCMEAKIVDENGEEVAEGEPGELWLKGPNIFVGYLDKPDLTDAAMSACGYFKTGDVFRRDKFGNYYCVDRLKELIKYKGFQVPPAELEGLLLGHDEILDVCVIGVDDREQATEVPRAYVVLRKDVQASDDKAKALMDWLASRVAPHKRLRGGIRFIDQVPKSPSGKILRRILKEQVNQQERADGPRL